MKKTEKEKNWEMLIMYPAWFLSLGFLFSFLIFNYIESVLWGVISLLVFFIIYMVMLKSHRKELDKYLEFKQEANK